MLTSTVDDVPRQRHAYDRVSSILAESMPSVKIADAITHPDPGCRLRSCVVCYR
jgi:hypothetical protein